MKRHVTFIVWLNIISFALTAIVVLSGLRFAFLASGVGVGFIGSYLTYYEKLGIDSYSVTMMWVGFLTSLPFALGLRAYKEWARILGLFLCILSLLDIAWRGIFKSFGVTEGVCLALTFYMIWVLTSKEVVARCRQIPYKEIKTA